MKKLKELFCLLFSRTSIEFILVSAFITKLIVSEPTFASALVLLILLSYSILRTIPKKWELAELQKLEDNYKRNIEKELEDIKSKVNRANTDLALFRQNRKL